MVAFLLFSFFTVLKYFVGKASMIYLTCSDLKISNLVSNTYFELTLISLSLMNHVVLYWRTELLKPFEYLLPCEVLLLL